MRPAMHKIGKRVYICVRFRMKWELGYHSQVYDMQYERYIIILCDFFYTQEQKHV